jgi:hypothetical protein
MGCTDKSTDRINMIGVTFGEKQNTYHMDIIAVISGSGKASNLHELDCVFRNHLVGSRV